MNCSVEKKIDKKIKIEKSSRAQKPAVRNEDDLIAQYEETFKRIGKFQGQYHITVDPNVPPVIHAAGRVPICLKDDQNELEKNGKGR